MNINYETYKIFLVIADNGSISQAAEVLNISQPAISWHIKNLESSLGTTLFIRTKKGVTLTYEGKILYSYVKEGINSITNGENIITNLKNLEVGSIRIGASATVSKHVIMPYLKEFHEQYPKIDIDITNNLTENLITDLRHGNLDILFLNTPMNNDKDLLITPIKEVQDIFVTNKTYYEKLKGKIPLETLKEYPLLFQKHPSNTRTFLDTYLANNNIKLNPKMEIVSYNLIMDFLKIGFGIGYATKEFITDELNKNELYELNIIPKVPKRTISIVTLKNTIPNYSVKKLIAIIENNEQKNTR